MSQAVDRRQFLRGDFAARRTRPRPPWSLPESEFLERCERCDDCIRHCPEGILIKTPGGFPGVDFASGSCTFCGECLRACVGRALIGDAAAGPPAWGLHARIGSGCLSIRGIVCRSCGEACDADAIRFRLEVGGIARPLIDPDRCTGCGACVAVCPVAAVCVAAAQPSSESYAATTGTGEVSE